jgi:hypothetical protein
VKTKNKQIDDTLEAFREKFILPTYLTAEEQRKMHSIKWKEKLQRDPLRLEIDDVVHKFYYTDPVNDYPNTMKTVRDIVNSWEDRPTFFQNLRPLLHGVKRSGRKLEATFIPKLIRRACVAGRLDIAIECVRHVEDTNLKLILHESVAELCGFIQKYAIDSRWKQSRIEGALTRLQMVFELLEFNKKHQPKPNTAGRYPFHRDPQFLAGRLHMCASRAVFHRGGQDRSGKVTKYAEELMQLWPEGAGLLDLQPDSAYHDDLKMRYLLNRNNYLWYASPILHGLTLAAQVVDPGLAMQLQNRADAVEAEVKAALAHESIKGGRGELMYNQIFNPQEEEEKEEA